MSKALETKKTLLSKIETIKIINDDPKEGLGSLANAAQKNIPNPEEVIGKKLGGLKNNKKKQKKITIRISLLNYLKSRNNSSQHLKKR